MQDITEVEFRQCGEAAVECLGDASVITQVGEQEGQGTVHIAVVFDLSQVVIKMFLYGADGVKRPGLLQEVFQLPGDLDRGRSIVNGFPISVDIAVKSGYPFLNLV